jgi:hypothetical protein
LSLSQICFGYIHAAEIKAYPAGDAQYYHCFPGHAYCEAEVQAQNTLFLLAFLLEFRHFALFSATT